MLRDARGMNDSAPFGYLRRETDGVGGEGKEFSVLTRSDHVQIILIAHDQRYDFYLFDSSYFPPYCPPPGDSGGNSFPPAPGNSPGTSGPLVSGHCARSLIGVAIGRNIENSSPNHDRRKEINTL